MDTVSNPAPDEPRHGLTAEERFLLETTIIAGAATLDERLRRLANLADRDVITGAQHLHMRRALEAES